MVKRAKKELRNFWHGQQKCNLLVSVCSAQKGSTDNNRKESVTRFN